MHIQSNIKPFDKHVNNALKNWEHWEGIGKSIPDPRDFLTPDRFPEAEVREKSRGSREVARAEGVDFPIPLEFLVEKGQSLIISREGLILTLSILPCPQGRIF